MTAPAPTELLKHWQRAVDKLENDLRTAGGFDTAASRKVAKGLAKVREKTAEALRQAASVERAEVAGEAVAWQRRFKISDDKWSDWDFSRHPIEEFREKFGGLIEDGTCEIRSLYASQPRSEGMRASAVRSEDDIETRLRASRPWTGKLSIEAADEIARLRSVAQGARECATCHAILADGPQPAATYAAQAWPEPEVSFLLDRLEEFDPGEDDAEREYHGHVAPAIARLRSAMPSADREGGK